MTSGCFNVFLMLYLVMAKTTWTWSKNPTTRLTARSRFNSARWHAGRRGIEFKLSFAEWDAWWLANGVDKDTDLARNLCMCRYGDIGAYELSNIYFATRSQNIRDGNQNVPRLRPGPGKQTYFGKQIQTPIGIFESRDKAAEALNLSVTGLDYRIKKQSNKYYYL